MARIISWSYWCTESTKDSKDYDLFILDTFRVANAGGGSMECRW